MQKLEFGKELVQQISSHEIFSFSLFGINIPVTDTVIVMWIIMAFLAVFSIAFTRSLKLIPEGRQNIAETIVEFINNFTKDIVGHHWEHFAPYIGTIFIFLIISNCISVFAVIPKGEELYRLTHAEFFRNLPDFSIRPPTKDVNTTMCMAVMSIIMVVYAGIRFKGLPGWLKSFVEPIPVMLPMKITEYLIRILSLSFRLFGNILGAFIIMEIVYFLMPAVIPAGLSIYFDLFDGVLQAFIFVFLTSIYIAEAVE